MPDITVQVTFDPTTTPPTFTFTPASVTMTAAGKVILQQSPANATWVFASPGATVANDTLNEFSATILGNGQQVQINDSFKDTRRTAYCYTCTVSQGAATYTSPDPEIVNDPPTKDP